MFPGGMNLGKFGKQFEDMQKFMKQMKGMMPKGLGGGMGGGGGGFPF